MSKLLRILNLTVAVTLTLLVVGAHQPAAAQRAPTESARVPQAVPSVVAAGHLLVNTYVHSGTAVTTIPSGMYTTLDKTFTINCPKGPCTLNAQMAAQTYNNTITENLVAVSMNVDGKVPNQCGFYSGSAPTDGSASILSNACHVSNLATGHHTVAMQVYVIDGGYITYWQAVYTLYEP